MTSLCLPMPLIISPIYLSKLTAPAAQVRISVTVELGNNIIEIFPITLPKKVKALEDAIRDFYCLRGGGLMKKVSGTDLFEVITDEDEQLSNGFEYKFVKSGISYPSLHSQ